MSLIIDVTNVFGDRCCSSWPASCFDNHGQWQTCGHGAPSCDGADADCLTPSVPYYQSFCKQCTASCYSQCSAATTKRSWYTCLPKVNYVVCSDQTFWCIHAFVCLKVLELKHFNSDCSKVALIRFLVSKRTLCAWSLAKRYFAAPLTPIYFAAPLIIMLYCVVNWTF